MTMLARFTLLALAVSGAACKSERTTQPVVAVARHIALAPTAQTIPIGGTATLAATVTDSAGIKLVGQTITWTASNSTVATVTNDGRVTAVAIGDATVSAAVSGISATATIKVIPVALRNFAIVGAQFTQGVQSADGAIPMVLLSKPAVVNVLIGTTVATIAPAMQVVLKLYDGNDVLIHTDTASTKGTLSESPTYASPSVQFLVAASLMQPGMRWSVVRDPRHLVTDENQSDDVYPREGTAALGTAIVQPLRLRLLPVRLDAHGGVLSALSLDQVPDFTRTLISTMPLGVTDISIGQPVVTAASFGTAPTGGEIAFWQQVLDDVDLARALSTIDPQTHWMAVVIPPSGFTRSTVGGIAYLPANGTQNGPRTRSSAGVGPGWFSSPTAARDLVAHELGHNFGRRHAPCGAAVAPIDPKFPTADGSIGFAGHDVFAWSHGLASSAPVFSAAGGDIMGYCTPAWASPYTYLGVLNFRVPAITSIVTPQPRQRVIIVRGSIKNGTEIHLEPAFTTTAVPSTPERGGDYRLQGLDANGGELFAYSFAPAVIDHAPDFAHFTFILPLSDSLESQLATLRVNGPRGVQVSRQSVRSAAETRAMTSNLQAPPYTMRRISATRINVSCTDTQNAGILVQHGTSAELLGTSPTRSINVDAIAGTPLTVLCSDGVRTVKMAIVAD